ncbi:hypothetical protein FGADI_11098 [Fusarium gaditjirri]|uniref:Small s protein n=1 Tax=Fusarium gaditjirri TaxID=282569 RepID=A0A8H4WQS7_9HYPO|nr:hypothetical protein FGADI_11098 [Fusarium gaditjirri]
MAEIIGLTASILTFVEFSAALLSAVQKVRAATDGTPQEIRELLEQADDIAEWEDRLTVLKSQKKLTSAELRVLKTGGACRKTADDIKTIAEKVSMRSGAKLKFLEHPRVVFGLLVSQPDLKRLQDRLMAHEKAVKEALGLLIRNKNHSETVKGLESLREEYLSFKIEQSVRFDEIQQEILAASQQISHDFVEFRGQVTSLRTKIESLENERQTCTKQIKVLKSLHFQEIRKRWDNIDDAAMKTLAWLHDPSKTSFLHWLSSETTDIYSIIGLPGSGKSTLMKFAFEHETTIQSLERWAGATKLCRASYFFWNQGFELQKSQIGLLRSLLYQVMRQIPSLVSLVDRDLDYEPWGFDELLLLFDKVKLETASSVKFCFFIDGLDEYDGSEEGIGQLIKSIAESPHIKICASSRPRSFFEQRLWSIKYSLTMQDLTKSDMRQFVADTLGEHVDLQQLQIDESGKLLLDQITEDAKGVWLWVHLVTRDLKLAVKGDETIRKLREIVQEFPKDLEKYFEHIIDRVEPVFRKEMARTFLVTIFEVQPLPLYAFYLLDVELEDKDYALKEQIGPLDATTVSRVGQEWKDKIHRRCSDLLVVDSSKHPVFLEQPVDFLHRTVRDFLRDQYIRQLEGLLTTQFIPPISLCRIFLFFLKKQHQHNLTAEQQYNSMIGLVDELLYYAREAEKHELYKDQPFSPVADILDQVDKVNTTIMKKSKTGRNHWTHARDPPATRGLDEYREGHHYNWISMAIQARLVKYVRGILEANRGLPSKNGRPLLDYALRPRKITPIQLPYHSQRDEPNMDRSMVELLLEHKANPNQEVYLNQDRTVWALFLISCRESVNRQEATPVSIKEWFEAIWGACKMFWCRFSASRKL